MCVRCLGRQTLLWNKENDLWRPHRGVIRLFLPCARIMRSAHDVEEAILLASRVVVMSARPGRIKEVIDIDIPYPRNQETKMLPRFTELKNYIWQNVYKEYLEVQK